MELTDLTWEQQEEIAQLIVEKSRSSENEQDIYESILSKHPKLVFLTPAKLLDFAKSYAKESNKKSEEKQKEYENMMISYSKSCQKTSKVYRLTLDEVEEIIERFNKHLWVAHFPTFNIIAIYWRLKRLFKSS